MNQGKNAAKGDYYTLFSEGVAVPFGEKWTILEVIKRKITGTCRTHTVVFPSLLLNHSD